MNYNIIGKPMPIVELKMNKGESVYTQSGAMCWMSEGMKMSTNMKGGFMKSLGRLFTGESLFMVTYEAERDNADISFAATLPGEIHRVELGEGKEYIAQKQSFLCAEHSVNLSVYFQKKIAAGLFGGEGFLLQKLSGSGAAYLEISGSVIERELAPGEKLLVDTSHVAYFENTCDFDVQTVKGFKNILFGGEGLFLTTITGPGKVWLQTMTAANIAEKLIPYIPQPSSSN